MLIASGVVMTTSTLWKRRGWEDYRPLVAGLVPETSRTAVSGLHFPTFFCLGRGKAEMWKVTGYVSTLLLCLEILCLQSESNWPDTLYSKLCRLFPCPFTLYMTAISIIGSIGRVLLCAGISVLSTGLCWSYQGSLENKPPKTNERVFK